jgi:hypothetical protein
MAGNSAGAKKGAKTKKEKYGPDFHSRAGSMGARLGTRGYFGKLKDENPKELKRLSTEAGKRSAEAKRTRKSETQVRDDATDEVRQEV